MSTTSTPSGTLLSAPKINKIYNGPEFAGDNSPITLEVWEFKLINAFNANGIADDMQQVFVGQGATTGPAANFLRAEVNKCVDKKPYKTFAELVAALTKRFNKGDEELDATLKLMELSMQPHETIPEYISRFQTVADKSELDDKTQCRVFVKGLRKDLAWLRRDLLDTMRKNNITTLLNQAQLLANQSKPFRSSNQGAENENENKKRKWNRAQNGYGRGRGRGRFANRNNDGSGFNPRNYPRYNGGRNQFQGRGGRGGRGRGRGRAQAGRGFDLSNVRCYKCGQYGHFADKCGNGNTKKLAALEMEISQLKTEKQFNEMYMAAMNVPTLAHAANTPGVPQQSGWPRTSGPSSRP